ncbi:pre-rRNA processing, partial [Coemansia sp. RSA 552]
MALPADSNGRAAASSRFSVLLESSVDYSAYKQARGQQFLQQPPCFDSLHDAEQELECVLHDEAFSLEGCGGGSVLAENVALAVDWYVNALERLFDSDEPFENADFLRLCCVFFASPLFENNARLVQRHLVKRTYAELGTGDDGGYAPTLWLLLALLHLVKEFQADTYLLCKDSGLFVLLQRLVLRRPDKNLHVLGMSLMFEMAHTVDLSQTDLVCVTRELLCFLLDYVEEMRYADSDIYNNTSTKLVLALNEQLLGRHGLESVPQSPVGPAVGDHQTLALISGSARRSYSRRRSRRRVPRPDGTMSVQSMSPPPQAQTLLPPAPQSGAGLARTHHHMRTTSLCLPDNAGADTDDAAVTPVQPSPLQQGSPAIHALATEDTQMLSRSRSMDFRAQLHGRLGGPGSCRSEACSPEPTLRDPGLDLAAAGHRTLVISILAQRVNSCKTFAENLVFLLNRERDPATQKLILHMLACILADPSTEGILYTNDMNVLTDIIIRDLGNMSEGEQHLHRAYLRVVCVLLRNPVYLANRHRLSDIELCLVNLLRQLLISSQAPSLASGMLSTSSSRRASVYEGSTRHNSIAMPADLRATTGGAESPALSVSSSVASEETCCTTLHPLRRRPPPPPPSPAPSSRPGSRDSTGTGSAHLPSGQSRRRRPPPPPPPRTGHLASPRLKPLSDSSSRPRPVRRKPPPPPPPSSAATAGAVRPKIPPAPPQGTDARKQKPEQSGIRRQLSVRRSVSRYKRDSRRRPVPPPPPRVFGSDHTCDSELCKHSANVVPGPVSPVIEVTAEEEGYSGGVVGSGNVLNPASGSDTHVESTSSKEDDDDEDLEDLVSASEEEPSAEQ